MTNATNDAEIKEALGTAELSSLSADQVERLLRFVAEGRLNAGHIQTLLQVVPHFKDMAVQAIQSMTQTVNLCLASHETAWDSMQSLARAVENSISALKALAETADNDELRRDLAEKICDASRLAVELATIVKNMNADNNTFREECLDAQQETNTWANVLGSVAMLIVVGVGASLLVNASNQSSKRF